ncbi:sigma-70 family RNA polymerase sigma factor [Paenibacillus glucanolyticus]|uniref:RNA polymerase subunit sigma n=1 Tax=Paenibacillus glucanolyticus TaxID=59843 RepID=A0A163INI7_9BACL|nr:MULTISPECIES: sigma-70 family RNA polymerase sigma factor [Paenibacillus]AWP30485.1 RNA polymerase subunit sigma [Paenibacillus sp. Cedars]KZS46055.1 RNA polymerase subunit sigma [Paenibacillus glucanolyticus]
MFQWIEDAKRGSAEAHEKLVKHYTGMALAVAYDKLQDPYLAEDAMQEAFTDAFGNLHKLQDPRRFPGWFKVIVERQCYRYLRRKQFRTLPLHELEQPIINQQSLESIVERREMIGQLHGTIEELPSNMRIAVQLYYFQGYSLQEISEYLDVSLSALKKRLFDARRKLKNTLHVADFVSVFSDLYEGGKRMLHIVNGDSVGDKLKQGKVQGDILVWRELYSFGPVFPQMDEPDNRKARAQYLEQTLGIPQKEYLDTCELQERKLQDFGKYDEVVLWFEHDLFDQTMLSYLLNWFKDRPLGNTKLSLLCIGAYPGIELFRGLGQLSSAQLETLAGTWHTIGDEELTLGSKVWEAYTSDQPQKHQRILQDDYTALPFVRDAFEAHLSRLPSVSSGLGIIEQATLEAVAGGINTPYELFRKVGDQLHVLGMGDLEFWYYLSAMTEGPHALLDINGAASFPRFKAKAPDFRDCMLQVTSLGRDVLAAKSDYAHTNIVDKWIGGLHLQGKAPLWRWDLQQRTIVLAGESE